MGNGGSPNPGDTDATVQWETAQLTSPFVGVEFNEPEPKSANLPLPLVALNFFFFFPFSILTSLVNTVFSFSSPSRLPSAPIFFSYTSFSLPFFLSSSLPFPTSSGPHPSSPA
ncbi:hypothetical protein GGS23DRAFT_170753 [Durotheca rogersii]|uniref:uncharacterized protein n=1 Tax=Durotheca rogersii TaxID=419775 RepID=UPI00221FC5B0|nr:uncharacterized protein GGS23DRAFT_170753 [Durotheca rogersii]KAI5867315.1 hypothetical protein GGS23DRAFT_170753 [Durotheca rogersii]